MYLTNDTANPKKYYISRASVNTLIPARQFVVFFADNQPTRGIFHLNFLLEESKYIALYDADGRTQIDMMLIPEELKHHVNISYGKDKDISITREKDDDSKWIEEDRYTPRESNEWQDKITKSQQISELDSTGMGMAIVAMAVVFGALIFIFFSLKSFTLADNISTKKKLEAEEAKTQEDVPVVVKSSGTEETGEICAAIAMALHLFASHEHDQESEIVTINKTIRPYSPWSQKHLILKRKQR